MKILMRNTVFKTAALAGLFLCMLAFAGAFFGITTSVHAVHADDVETEAQLKEFVEEAVDEYYAGFLLKEHCDLAKLELPTALQTFIPVALDSLNLSVPIQDLTRASINMLTIEDIKKLIALFDSPQVQPFLPDGINLWEGADPPCVVPDNSSFQEVFMQGDERWNSGSIYLFVAQYPQGEQRIIFHGQDPDLLAQDLTGLQDEGNRPIMELIEQAADGTVQGRTEAGFLDYCWEDPSVENDEIEDMNPLTAPGDSWKTSYVVDSFDYLGMPAPINSPRVIFGSGIYPDPQTGNPPPGCDGNGMADYDGGDMNGGGDDMDGNGDDMDGGGDDMDGGGDDMDGGGDDMDGGGDDIVDAVTGGGCTIAAGSDSMPRGTAFNLLLIVSALFFTVSFRRRAMDK